MTGGGALHLEAVSFVRPGTSGEGERTVLDEVTAELPAGRASLVEGPTGSGKSTLLHLLAGLLRPTAGVVRAGGEPISRWTAAHRDLWRRQVGIAFQEPRLLEGLSALENVMVPLVPRAGRLGGPEALRARALEALDALGAAPLAGRDAGGLSGGERQRVAVARALAGSPLYLILDEPTSQQDGPGVEAVLAAAEAAADRGAVVVVATHDPRAIEAWQGGAAAFHLEGGRLEGGP